MVEPPQEQLHPQFWRASSGFVTEFSDDDSLVAPSGLQQNPIGKDHLGLG